VTRVSIIACLFLAAHAAAADEPLTFDPRMHPDQVRGNIEVWSWNIAAGSLTELVPGFEATYPRSTVNINMTGSNMQSRFFLSLSAGVGAPDISQLQIREAARYTYTRRLTDLTAVAGKYADQFPRSSWEDCLFEGRVYAIPWDTGPCAVFYRRDMFDDYGIDPASIETWDDYLEAGKAILERSNGKTKMLFLPTHDILVMFTIVLQQINGQVFDDQGRIAINSNESLKVLELVKKFLEAGICANERYWMPAFYAALGSDRVATYPMAAWFGGMLKDSAPETAGNWGVFRLPALEPGGLRTSISGGSVLVIPDQCKQKEAAWAFVEYALCTPGPQIEQYKSFDLFPALLTTHQDPFFDEPDPFFGGQKVRRLFAMDVEKIPVMNRTKDWMEAERYLQQALSKWATSGMNSPEQFLMDLEYRLSRRLAREISPASLRYSGGQ